MRKHIFVIFLLSLSFVTANSQNSADYDKFVAEAGDYLNLYRGTTAIPYKNLHIGTYFAFSENFEKGNLLYNGKTYHDVEMNLNSHLDELYVKIPGSGRVVTLNKEFTDFFSLGKKNFVRIGERNETGAPQPGYYQILYNGESKLYKKIRKVYSEKIGSSINSVTKSKLERRYDLTEQYYLLKNKVWYKIPRRNSLIMLYREKRTEIRRFIRTNNLGSTDNTDQKYIEILKFVELPTNN